MRDRGSVQGCLERGGFGHIAIRPFTLSIKGLDNEYDFNEAFKLGDWPKLLGFMQHMAAFEPHSPKNLIDMISDCFLSALST